MTPLACTLESEQFLLGSWLVSQGRRQQFARTSLKSSCKRGVFLVFRDFGWGFGPLDLGSKFLRFGLRKFKSLVAYELGTWDLEHLVEKVQVEALK